MKCLPISCAAASLLNGLLAIFVGLSASGMAQASELFPKHLADAVVTSKHWQDADPAVIATPAFSGFVTDPDTRHKVWRLGGDNAEMGGSVSYPEGNGAIGILHAQHFYSKTSPTNSSESHVLSSGGQNQRYAALWRLSDRKLVAWVPGPERQAHIQQRQLLWDKKQDNVYWYAEANRLVRAVIDFSTYRVETQVWERFDDYQYITFGFGEGNFSDNGERLVIAGKSALNDYLYFTPYEVLARKKHPARQVTFVDQTEFDWVGVDPTGEYILFDRRKPEKQTVVVSFEQASVAEPHLIYPHTKHSDFVIDQSGVSWIVYGNWQGLFASRLSDGKDKKIWPLDNQGGNTGSEGNNITASGHVARVASIPGLVLVSRNYDGGLYFMNIDQPGASVYLGNTRHGRKPEGEPAEKTNYWGVNEHGETTFYKREPRGAVSASGRYVFFVSDYQTYLGQANGYDPEPAQCKAYLNMIDLVL